VWPLEGPFLTQSDALTDVWPFRVVGWAEHGWPSATLKTRSNPNIPKGSPLTLRLSVPNNSGALSACCFWPST
jgi:hypothetical protein